MWTLGQYYKAFTACLYRQGGAVAFSQTPGMIVWLSYRMRARPQVVCRITRLRAPGLGSVRGRTSISSSSTSRGTSIGLLQGVALKAALRSVRRPFSTSISVLSAKLRARSDGDMWGRTAPGWFWSRVRAKSPSFSILSLALHTSSTHSALMP